MNRVMQRMMQLQNDAAYMMKVDLEVAGKPTREYMRSIPDIVKEEVKGRTFKPEPNKLKQIIDIINSDTRMKEHR